MRIVIIGIGAMGSLFAGRLSVLADIVMIGNWPSQLSALQDQGLLLIHPDGAESRLSVSATNNYHEVGGADLALVLVKGWQTAQVTLQVRQLLSSDGMALTLQNGLGNLEILAEVIGFHRVALGVTSEGANMISPGVVRHAGKGQTHLATTPETTGKMAEIAVLFNAAGFETYLVDDADGLIWGKLAVNAGINPLTGLLQVPNGYLVEEPVARDIMCRSAEETAAVAMAQGIKLPYESASERTIEVAKATAANRSSMAQDLARGMPTEIEMISGAIVRYGLTFGIPTPLNEALLRLVNAQKKTGAWRTNISQLQPAVRSEFQALAQLEVPR